MWSRLGKIQHLVLKVLNTKTPDPDSFVYTMEDGIQVRIEGWFNIDNVVYHILNEFDEDGNLLVYHEATESERQCIWAAIRGLEGRGLIEAKVLPISWSDRFSNMPKHCGPGYYGKLKRGHRNRKKIIRLSPLVDPIGLDDHKRVHEVGVRTPTLAQLDDPIGPDDHERGRKGRRGDRMTENGFIYTHSERAIALVLSLLRERAKRQPRGFQISSRAVRKALAEHFDRNAQGVTLLGAFVMHTLVARGILKPFNTTTKREVFRVDGVTFTNALESRTPKVFPVRV